MAKASKARQLKQRQRRGTSLVKVTQRKTKTKAKARKNHNLADEKTEYYSYYWRQRVLLHCKMGVTG
jgi:hypothetical protein